jgi:nitrogen fixation NifU-like protein
MTKTILDNLLLEAKNPYNYGKLAESTGYVELNPSCGDAVKIYLKVINNHVSAMYFESKGCVLSKAVASKLARFVENKEIYYLKEIDPRELLQTLIGLQLGPNRARCGLMAIYALKKGLDDA